MEYGVSTLCENDAFSDGVIYQVLRVVWIEGRVVLKLLNSAHFKHLGMHTHTHTYTHTCTPMHTHTRDSLRSMCTVHVEGGQLYMNQRLKYYTYMYTTQCKILYHFLFLFHYICWPMWIHFHTGMHSVLHTHTMSRLAYTLYHPLSFLRGYLVTRYISTTVPHMVYTCTYMYTSPPKCSSIIFEEKSVLRYFRLSYVLCCLVFPRLQIVISMLWRLQIFSNW